jgi:hypothetical protein
MLCLLKTQKPARHQGLTSIILAIWEAEIGRIIVPGQSSQIVHKTPNSKITRANHNRQTGGMVRVLYNQQSWSPEFKPQYTHTHTHTHTHKMSFAFIIWAPGHVTIDVSNLCWSAPNTHVGIFLPGILHILLFFFYSFSPCPHFLNYFCHFYWIYFHNFTSFVELEEKFKKW